jgi:hypothetical protein
MLQTLLLRERRAERARLDSWDLLLETGLATIREERAGRFCRLSPLIFPLTLGKVRGGQAAPGLPGVTAMNADVAQW